MLGTFVKQRRQSSERLLPASLWARRVHRPIRLFRSSFPGRDFGRPPLLPPFGLIIEALFPCGRFSPENELDEIDLLGHDHRVDYCRDNQCTDAPSSTDQVLLIGKAAQVNGRLLQSSLLPPGAIKNLVHVPLTNHAFIRYSLGLPQNALPVAADRSQVRSLSARTLAAVCTDGERKRPLAEDKAKSTLKRQRLVEPDGQMPRQAE